MNITIVGAGYVGLSIATLLSRHNTVSILETNLEQIEKINHRICPFHDPEIENYFQNQELHLSVGNDAKNAYKMADFVVVAVPTDYDGNKEGLNTSIVEKVIDEIHSINPQACIVIKSTIPIGFTSEMKKRYPNALIVFSPEFLREGKALYDNLYPSRIIIGCDKKNEEECNQASIFASLLKESSLKPETPLLVIGNNEAEAVKLFSNTYLATRIAFFNELDNFALANHLNSCELIKGISYDPRIGDFYNNPSFGFGGYCLPKDSKELSKRFGEIPHSLIASLAQSNEERATFVVEQMLQFAKEKRNTTHPLVGLYRLNAKTNSDNCRTSAALTVVDKLIQKGFSVLIFEPTMKKNIFSNGVTLMDSFTDFLQKSDVILANRLTKEIEVAKEKVFTRDIFYRD